LTVPEGGNVSGLHKKRGKRRGKSPIRRGKEGREVSRMIQGEEEKKGELFGK